MTSIRYRLYFDHPICGDENLTEPNDRRVVECIVPPDCLDESGKAFWREQGIRANADAVVVAYAKHRVVGFVRLLKFPWPVGSLRSGRGTRYLSAGSWVTPTYRRCGVGREMWQHVFAKLKPHSVEITVVSHGGYHLACAVQRKFGAARVLVDDRRPGDLPLDRPKRAATVRA